MKKQITLLFIFCVGLVSAQMTEVKKTNTETIGKIAPMGQLHISIEKSPDTYIFTYADVKYQNFDVYQSFQISLSDFDDLYNRIIKGYEELPEEPIQLQLEEGGYLFLEFQKTFGVRNFRFNQSLDESGQTLAVSIWITEKKLKKLFGK